MPGQAPDKIRLFRIVHRDNVAHLLRHGMYTREHPQADPGYISIGDNHLIGQRDDYAVGINPPNGTLGAYIPFYFGPLSPMLLNIKTGHRGIMQRPQAEVVYICCELHDLIAKCPAWCFTDGHAKNSITSFFNDLADLDKVDWGMVFERYWRSTDEDYDRMRRKQAEFLVKDHVPAECVRGLIVYDEATRSHFETLMAYSGVSVPVVVNPNQNYYY